MAPEPTGASRADRLVRIREICEAALESPPDARGPMIREACGDDASMRAEVESLVARLESDDAEAARRSPREAGDLTAALLGARVGPYRMVAHIDTGGMSMVFAAEQENLRRTVAVKILLPHLLMTGAAQRFRSEPIHSAQFKHPAIAHVYDAGVFERDGAEWPYIAMELIEGARTITAHARERGLDVPDRVRLMATVCDAVAGAHGRCIIHRDLKPGNILVGRDGAPKVIDFGIARSATVDELSGQTMLGDVLGTPEYMSPEQLRGEASAVGVWSDVFALGCVLYELLADRKPFDLSACRSLRDAAAMIADAEPPPLSRANTAADEHLSAIVARAMHADETRRTQTALQLRDELESWLSGGRADAPAAVSRAAPPRANRVTVMVLSSIVVICALVIAVLTSQLATWKTDEALAERELAAMQQQRDALTEAQRRSEAQLNEARSVAAFLASVPAGGTGPMTIPAESSYLDALATAVERARVSRSLPAADAGGRRIEGRSVPLTPGVEAELLRILAENYKRLGDSRMEARRMRDAFDILLESDADAERVEIVRHDLAYAAMRAEWFDLARRHFDTLIERASDPTERAILMLDRLDCLVCAGGAEPAILDGGYDALIEQIGAADDDDALLREAEALRQRIDAQRSEETGG